MDDNELARRMQEGDRKAGNLLAAKYMTQAKAIAAHWSRNHRHNRDESMDAAMEGLAEALRAYRPERKDSCQLDTFVWRCVRQRLSHDSKSAVMQYTTGKSHLARLYPQFRQAMLACGHSPEEMKRRIQAGEFPPLDTLRKDLLDKSIHAVICFSGGKSVPEDRLHLYPHPEKDVESARITRQVKRAIASLPPSDRKVIHFYIYKGECLAEISRRLGVSRERVRQIRERAFDRLRTRLQGLENTIED